ncbi:hypothetical protein ACF08M_40505, partial [Streptomyces sp. NPDC015032]|uniref:hypothetical protein n=1 Tax=Streptomyces sp. NPDC015032 TaxID=3364937 RepID=UPI00370279FC
MATTEGYASHPGGAQAELLSEVNKHESERNLQLVLGPVMEVGLLPTSEPGRAPSGARPGGVRVDG